MRAFWKVAAATTFLTGSAVALGASPAGASVTVSVSATTITVTMVGDEDARFGCSAPTGGVVQVNGTNTSPTLACGALTKVTVNGDGGPQAVVARDLNKPEFGANPYLVASMGAGFDVVHETDRADSIDMGADNDQLNLYPPSVTNTLLQMGAASGQERAVISGSSGDDTVNALSNTATLGITTNVGGQASSYNVLNVDRFDVSGNGGDDTISTAGITAASSVSNGTLRGDDGDDTITTGAVQALVIGGEGANTLSSGSAGVTFLSQSDTDTINPGSGTNRISDEESFRSGNRTIGGVGSNRWTLAQFPGDAVARIRGGSTFGSSLLTASLSRTGQQRLPATIDDIEVELDTDDEPHSLGLVDAVASNAGVDVFVVGDGGAGQLVDFTVPSGTWTTSGTLGDTYVVTTGQVGMGDLQVTGVTNVSVHGSWPNANRSFAHRITRDLMFRFPSPAVINDRETRLSNGTLTRAAIIASLMDTDEYRGLDVDRVFLKFLRRVSDPGGRTYWINSLRNGKSLLQFRAQLFGSTEYFTKAGGTNAAYMVKAYQDVMGRAPDPSGQAYWTNKLNTGTERGIVAREFLKSTEARRNIVKDQFLRFIDRFPTTPESEAWVANLASATGEQDLIAFLTGSGAYLTRT